MVAVDPDFEYLLSAINENSFKGIAGNKGEVLRFLVMYRAMERLREQRILEAYNAGFQRQVNP